MRLPPLRYAHNNILFGMGEERVALYRVGLESYPFLPLRDKLAAWNRLRYFAFSVGADFSLWRVSRSYPADRYVAQAQSLLDPEHGERVHWVRFLERHERHLRAAAPHLPELYLAVSLAAPAPRGATSALLAGADRARRRVERLLGVAGAQPVSDQELEVLGAAEERTYTKVAGALSVQRASTEELQWLIRRAFCRGVTEPAIDTRWEPNALVISGEGDRVQFHPLETDLLRLANAAVLERDRMLVVDAEEGRSHQALLGVGALPEDDFPSGQLELLSAPLEALPFPVDACLHVRWIPNREAVAKVRKRIIDADNVFADQTQSEHGASFEADENRVIARELEAHLKSEGHPPLVHAAISLAVGAPTEEELEARLQALQAHYGTVPLHRPLGLQARLFAEHLPRCGMGVDDYADYLTIDQLAALMPTATHQVGAARGIYLGHTTTGGRRPVKFDPTEASREARPPTLLLAGTLGSGKTLAAELLGYAAERRGSLVITVDPKPDHQLDKVPELHGRVDVIELSGDEQFRGLLDPLAVAAPSLREDLAASYLMEILPQAPPAWETQIRRAVRDAVAQSQASLLSVLEHLGRSPHDDARAAADALEVWADAGLGRLAFAPPGRRALRARRPVTTLRADGLALPSPAAARADYTQSERLSVATLKLVAAFAMRLAADPARHAMVVFDEAWMLLGAADGRRLVDRLARLGRSQNATLVLASQTLGDIGELEALVGTQLIFGLETVAEARRALALLGLDPDDEALVARVRAFRRGRCLMRDLDDRVGELQVDLVDPELLAALDTTPRAHRRAAA